MSWCVASGDGLQPEGTELQHGVPADWLWCHPLHEHHDNLPEVGEQPPQSGELVWSSKPSASREGRPVLPLLLEILLLNMSCFPAV